MKPNQFSFQQRLKSFRFAFNGIISFLQKEHNAWIHLLATIVVIVLGLTSKLSSGEWVAILLAVALVWMSEMFNTCIEKLIDFIAVDKHPSLKFIKDVAAGAVLVCAITSIVIALIIFIPHFNLF
ncbi:MAG: diacylglycerol kinase family protein [Chitinophagaceae bacterium]